MPLPYPSDYILSVPSTLFVLAFGPHGGLVLFLLAIGLTVVLCTARLCERLGATPLVTAAGMAFALFNPWVYTESVAGHLGMILAYGGSIGIVALLREEASRWNHMALLLAVVFVQIQFFVLMMTILLITAKQRSSRLAFAFGAVIASPVILGIFGEYGWLQTIPYTIVWQASQSVRFDEAIFLMGYFAGYTDRFYLLGAFGVGCIVVLALVGALLERDNRRRVAAIGVLLVMLTAITGLRGWFGPWYAYVVERVPATALFRELYDLLAYVAIWYILFAVYACVRVPHARFVLLCGACIGIASWLAASPWSFFVPQQDVPRLHVAAPANTRFALLPAYQPMGLARIGSGADPDAYARANNIMPLNTYTIAYPADWALSTFSINGSVEPLAALSVSELISRPWLQTNLRSLDQELAAAALRPEERPWAGLIHIHPLPELSEVAVPQVGSLNSNLGAGNIFFGDAAVARGAFLPPWWSTLPHFSPILASNRYLKVGEGWVDARLLFAERPEVAQGLGGVVTTSPTAILALKPKLATLVDVSGRLVTASGKIAARDTHDYAWISLPTAENLVRCLGFCLVIGQAAMRHSFPLKPAARPFRAISFRQRAPWLATATLPPSGAAVLRYNVGYEAAWLALMPGRSLTPLTHIRLDTTVNGWFVPPLTTPNAVVLINWIAALQLVLELIGALVFSWVGLCTLLTRSTASDAKTWGNTRMANPQK